MKSKPVRPQRRHPAFDGGLDRLETLYDIKDKPARDDLSLCFLCLRWSSGDDDCRNGVRCEMQLKLDSLEKRLEATA